MLIAIEGVDGAGKTTLARQLGDRLSQRGWPLRPVRRYFVPELTSTWRRLVELDAVDQRAAAEIAATDYGLGLATTVQPALTRGEVVLADRYVYSHFAYFAIRGIPLARLRRMFPPIVEPDLVFYLSVPLTVAVERLRPLGKPDFWEAALDHRPHLTIGQALRRFRERPPAPDAIARRFIRAQRRADAAFVRVLPRGVTRRLDGRRRIGDLCDECVRLIDARLDGGALAAC